MADPQDVGNPPWPPLGDDDGPGHPWLRFQNFTAGGRRAILAAHLQVPYSVEIDDSTALNTAAPIVAYNYLIRLNEYLEGKHEKGLGVPPSWLKALAPGEDPPVGIIRWLPIWPSPGGGDLDDKPRLASWNLSRQKDHELPAEIMMVASEVYADNGTAFSYEVGLTVPMAVVQLDDGRLRLTARSVSAELPRLGQRSLTEIAGAVDPADYSAFFDFVDFVLNEILTSDALAADSAIASNVNAETLAIDELRFSIDDASLWRQSNWRITSVGKARGAVRGGPRKQSYQVLTDLALDPVGILPSFKVLGAKKHQLTTHASPGDAMVFRKTPPGWFDNADPDADYDYRSRRPAREDEILDTYRSLEMTKPMPVDSLEDPGFVVRLCPDIVKADRGVPGTVKKVDLPGDAFPAPRSDDLSAISAFRNCRMFFDLLAGFGLTPQSFVVRAQKDAQVFYRSGIFPGPGGDGRTINAQVAFDCPNKELPFIDMRYAIAQHNRWARAGGIPGGSWAQPLGITTSGRWVMHEFGHYLLAARIGKLEFDFAHSAGDAMAAVYFDPLSRLADIRGGVSENFRGYTFPFVFATRRHDREVGLGWAWYGALNRSALNAPPGGCNDTKAYLTEQILSSSIFRLYRSLGGDTMSGDAPDRYTRHRAAHMTLFLLIRAIAGFGPVPSVAETLELAMETAGVDMVTPLLVPPEAGVTPPTDDEWDPALTHKTVRWAYEAQGMFPADPDLIHNAPGAAPPVDLYIVDDRPTQVSESSGIVTYGAGSYVPVSLDWTGQRLWTVDPGTIGIEIGNRGTDPANNTTLRIWIGSAAGHPDDTNWELKNLIKWHVAIGPLPVGTIAAQAAQLHDAVREESEAVDALNAPVILVLYEVSAPYDAANTDPAAGLPPAVPDGNAGLSALPTIPRRLTDLVASDNNLGLKACIGSAIS